MATIVVRTVRIGLREDLDVMAARRVVTEMANEIGFGTLDRTKIVTAASELARNTVLHGHGGVMQIETVREGIRLGLRLTFDDTGPGIADIGLAMQDGYSTGKGMGLGLPGARRLCSEFALTTNVGVGTSVTVVRWKP